MPQTILLQADLTPETTGLSPHTPNYKIQRHLDDAVSFDLKAAVGKDLYTDLLAMSRTNDSNLRTFYEAHVLPFLRAAAYVRYIGVGNLEDTGAGGFRYYTDDTSAPVSASTIAYFAKRWELSRDENRQAMLNALSEAGYKIGDKQYEKPNQYTRPAASRLPFRAI